MPLEEVATLFGDQDEVVVFSADIQAGSTEDELVVTEHHGKAGATENMKEETTPTHRETVDLTV